MAKGQPDFGSLAPTETIVGISDLGELAARLGSPVIFDRRGNVLFMETFKDTLSRFGVYTSGSGGSVSISSERAHLGAFSCKIETANAIGAYGYIMLNLSFPALSKMGVEIAWLPYDGLDYFYFDLWLYDGSRLWDAWVRWKYTTGYYEYQDDAENWIILSPAVRYQELLPIWNIIKLVVDFEKKEYVRLIANNLVWDLTGKPLANWANTDPPHLGCEVKTTSRLISGSVVYLDNLIITQNEP